MAVHASPQELMHDIDWYWVYRQTTVQGQQIMDPSAPSIQKFDATPIEHEALAHAPMYNQHHHLEHRLMHLIAFATTMSCAIDMINP